MSGISVSAYTFFYQGLPASGGSLNVYQTGTTTPVAIYSDAGLITPLANPLTLDANGQAAFYYAGTVSLKLVAFTATGSLIQTLDPVYPVGGAQTATIVGGSINNTPIGATTPSTGAFTTLTATTPNVSDNSNNVATTAFVSQSTMGGFLNKFRNATLDIWQRGGATALSVSTSGAYTADGWIVTPLGATCQVQQVSNALNTPFSINSMRLTGGNNVSGINLKQRIESYIAQELAGQNVTVQFELSNFTGGTITPTLTIRHASAQDNWSTSVVEVNGVNLQPCANNTNTLCAYTFTASAIAMNGMEVEFDFGNNFNSGTKSINVSQFDIRWTPDVTVGLNPAPPWPEIRNIAQEMVLCQRYFASTFGNNNSPGQNFGLPGALGTQPYGASAGEAFIQWNFPAQMRVPPAITTYNPGASNANWRDVSGSGDVTVSVDPDSAKGTSGVLIGTQTTALTAGHHLYIHATASAEL